MKSLFTALLALSAMSLPAETLPTGPAVGDPIPTFATVDQNGVAQSFDSLKGPNGLLLLFHRSADW